jgi:hypothetical protein
VPKAALLTPRSIPESFCSTSGRELISVHGLLASFIAFDEAFNSEGGRYAVWKATWPSFEDFRSSMPLLWPERCRDKQSLSRDERSRVNDGNSKILRDASSESCLNEDFSVLPASIAEILEAQAVRYRLDFIKAVSLMSSAKEAYKRCNLAAEDEFKYAWCIVNTRCLYFHPSSTSSQANHRYDDSFLVGKGLSTPHTQICDSNQFMCLCPLIDLFNHTSDSGSACEVTHDHSAFTVTSQKAYTGYQDEEIFVSYGPHSNDFLFVEYGFILSDGENKHDSIGLDSVILPTLSMEQKRILDAKGYLGEYTLFSSAANGGEAGICWRTNVVARIGFLSLEHWERLVDGILDEDAVGEDVKKKAKIRIRGWVEELKQQAGRNVQDLDSMGSDEHEVTELFGDDVENSQSVKAMGAATVGGEDGLNTIDSRTQVARRRYDLVLKRWKQILDICSSFLQEDEP